MGETGVGTHIFGKDFNPREINLPQAQETNQKIISNAIAFFVDGGNYAAMKPTNEIIKHIELARQAASGQEVHVYGARNRDQLPLISKVLGQVGYTEASEKIEKALSLPLAPKELAVGGRELMQVGLRGPEIGLAQKQLIQAIHDGIVSNEEEQLLDFLRGTNETTI